MMLTLPASSADEPHVIVPYTFGPGELGRFKLSLWADVPCRLAPLSAVVDEPYTSYLDLV